MNSIAFDVENSKAFLTRIEKFFSRYHIGSVLKQCNAYKKQGLPVVRLVQYLFQLVFQGRSMFADMQSQKAPEFKKDTVYRMENADYIDWKRFTTLVSADIVKETIDPLTSDSRRSVFVVDDSIYDRNRSQKVELLTRRYDQANHQYVKGFRMLTLGWSDGVTFLPVNSCLLSTENTAKQLCKAKDKANGSTAAAARKLAQTKATEVVPILVKEDQNAGIRPKYILSDSWFSSPKEICSMKELNLDVVAIVKNSQKVYYLYNGKRQSVKDIYAQNKKRRGRSRYLLSVTAAIENESGEIPVKLVFVRNRKNRKDYLVLASTDTSLSEDEIIQLYGKRWDIEVFFKVSKSLLKLTKGNRSLSYDAMCAHTAIVFLRYMFLAVSIREDKDIRTAGPMFCMVADKLADVSLKEAMAKLQLFLEKLVGGFNITNAEIQAIVDDFVVSLPKSLAGFLTGAC